MKELVSVSTLSAFFFSRRRFNRDISCGLARNPPDITWRRNGLGCPEWVGICLESQIFFCQRALNKCQLLDGMFD